jgi:DNA mismatch endonuclease, patch repair protein
MPDIFTKRKRSDVMSRIRGTGNKATELRLIQIFRANGINGWRRGCALRIGSGVSGLASGVVAQSPKNLKPRPKTRATRSTGRVKPDFVFQKLKVALFVDGCFWHGCPRHATWPKTRAAFWLAKITGNKARDRRVNSALRKRGWTVLRIWEHELARNNAPRLLKRLAVLRP